MEKAADKRQSKRRRIWLFLPALVVTAGLFLLGAMIYTKYVLPRPVEWTTFSPLERKIFDLDASEIEAFEIVCKVDLERHREYEEEFGKSARTLYTFEAREEVEEIVEYLNSFRYTITAPGTDFRNWVKGTTPSHCWLSIIPKDKELDLRHWQFFVEENRLCIGEVWYYGDPEFFDRFLKIEAPLFDGDIPEF